jgi:50S ribosomal subunit-associated GTPase HflX
MADVLVHLVDASNPMWKKQVRTSVHAFHAWKKCHVVWLRGSIGGA